MQKIRVGVLRGGPSSEYEVSLNTGATVLRNLEIGGKYEPKDILISKTGGWHEYGIEKPLEKILRSVDVVWNALHGEFGEDGQVQGILEIHKIPFTGSKKIPSAVAMNKLMTKSVLAAHLVRMPRHVAVEASDDFDKAIRIAFNSFSPPYVVKPRALGSSVGVKIVGTAQSLPAALREIFDGVSDQVLIEEYIAGREATCGVVDSFRGQDIYPLFPIEIVPSKEDVFYDYNAKYLSDKTNYICPGNFSEAEKREISRVASLVHQELGLRHYSRSDFIVSPRHGIYFLEVNTLPGMTAHSLVPKSLEAIGCAIPEFLDHVLTLALEER